MSTSTGGGRLAVGTPGSGAESVGPVEWPPWQHRSCVRQMDVSFTARRLANPSTGTGWLVNPNHLKDQTGEGIAVLWRVDTGDQVPRHPQRKRSRKMHGEESPRRPGYLPPPGSQTGISHRLGGKHLDLAADLRDEETGSCRCRRSRRLRSGGREGTGSAV